MNIIKEIDNKTSFGHLITSLDMESTNKIVNYEGYPECSVEIKINDVIINNDMINDFINEIIESNTEYLEKRINDFDKEVIKKAKELIQDKIGSLWSNLSMVEDNLGDILSGDYIWNKGE